MIPTYSTLLGDDNVQVFGRARNGPAAPPEATTHPLLLDASSAANRAPPGQSRGTRQPQRIVAGGTTDLLQTIEDLIGGGAVQLFHHIMTRGRGGGGPETIRLDVPTGTLVNLERGYLQQRRPQGVISAAVRVERAPQGDARGQGRDLDPLLTLQRWAEEIKILHGDFVAERVGKLANHVSLALLPAAVEAAKQAKIKEEEESSRRREVEAKAEEEAATEEKVKAEQTAARDAEEATRHEVEKAAEPAAPATVESMVAENPAQEDHTMEDTHLRTPDLDGEMLDATVTPAPAAEGEPNAGAVSGSEPTEEGPSETSSTRVDSSNAPERVTVIIHGSPVDITDTGIDPTFLEALPDDMREEVLNQHVRDQRAARVERPPDSQISSEFLDALPPEIRAEIIQQERLEQARRRAEETAPSGGQTAAPAEIDPASFIASLDPTLRQAVLLDQDDGFIQTLPSHMIAEAGVYREGHQPRRQFAIRGVPRTVPPGAAVPRKFTPQHDAIQLLDKVGIAVLVRLLFFPQVLRKTLLFKVLVNLCENAKTRTELFNLLLSILQDGTGDLAAVDKSFAQMSFRNSKPQTPKAAGKQKAGSDYLTALALPTLQNEAVPDLIAQRCLEGLTFIVSSNELSSLFFLTEHELPAGLRRSASKKGKGKERQIPQTHYPIVLLLGLLDRQSLLKTPSIMESVVGLLATVTRPLTSIKDVKKGPEASTSSAAPPAPPAPPSDTVPPPSDSTTATIDSAPPHSDPAAPPTLSDSAPGSVPSGLALEPDATVSGEYMFYFDNESFL
jgi:E3 ubiquitin-protein ligase HUWE1